MKLRSQMLLVGALTLVVPIVGWQSAKRLYKSLQETRIEDQSLKVANFRLALVQSDLLDPATDPVNAQAGPFDLYAEVSPYPLFLDGYADDWKPLRVAPVEFSAQRAGAHPSISVRAARRDKTLMLHIRVSDDQIVYHQIPVFRADAGEGEQPDRWTQLVNGDSIELLVDSRSRDDSIPNVQHGLFRAIAPGPLTALQASDGPSRVTGKTERAGRPISNWQAYWQNASGGYQLEIQLPLPASGSLLGISVVDVDYRGESRTRWSGSLSPLQMAGWHADGTPVATAGRVFYISDQLENRLQDWISPGTRVRVYDQHGRLVADVNELYTRTDLDAESADEAAFSSKGVLNALLFRVFSFFVAGDLPLLPENRPLPDSLDLAEERRAGLNDNDLVTSRYVTEENDRVLGTLAGIGDGQSSAYLLYEANEEHDSAYAGSQVARLFTLLLLVSLLAGTGLLVFALVLSSRISRLSQQAHDAFSTEGRVQGLSGGESRDEIGELSRQLSALLSRSAAYTGYLETLSGSLSHELRTPLSVVRTSLENLDTARLDKESQMLVERAAGGADQLARIIKVLVDSTRLEQIVLDAQTQRTDLTQWISHCESVYSQLYPSVDLSIKLPEQNRLMAEVSIDLLQQAMDKLVANAVDHGLGTGIVIELRADDGPHGRVTILVANAGDLNDESTALDLFNPLVSSRKASSEQNHSGLGLYIVRLVAEASGGEVYARNGPGWVEFGLTLPLVKA